MNRKQLEHVLRAGGSLTSSRDLVVIGSQAILGSFPNAPLDMLTSMEADVYPMDAPEKADIIDGCIGELSPFHETFGYYAHGIGPETAVLPAKWKTRLVRVEAGETLGWCLSPVDLAVSKIIAGREKDIGFVRGMLRSGFITESVIKSVVGELKPDEADTVLERLALCR
jgi:hypothetical protein